MQDKEKLKKLIEIFEELLKIKGNEWLIDAILEKIKKVSTVEEIANHSVIQDIHEYCIEKVIIKQANDFYADFSLDVIKQEIIKDYIKMEHERRRDDFENFSLCVYQQIENITNYLFDEFVIKQWDNEKDKPAIKSYYNSQLKSYTFPDRGGKSLDSLIFENTTDKKWYANRKFRAILYFVYFNMDIAKDDYQFNSIYYIHEEIYQIRNQNHRGSKPSDYQLKTLNKIKGKESKYYFKFYGFLENFIRTINENLANHYATKIKNQKIENQKNTIGANNPALQELLNKMNEKK